MRPLLYVAGPLGLPSVIGWDAVLRNMRAAQAAGMQLVHAGWSPVVPHQNATWPDAFETPHATWLEVDEALVLACRAIVRLPGDFNGADRELEIAREAGLSVFDLAMALRGPSKVDWT